jgi:hypothetical protein
MSNSKKVVTIGVDLCIRCTLDKSRVNGGLVEESE